MRPPSLHTLTALYEMVEKHEGMQSCCKHQQCCTHITRGRMRVRVLHVSRIRSEMQHRDRYRDKREEKLGSISNPPWSVQKVVIRRLVIVFLHAVIKYGSKPTTQAPERHSLPLRYTLTQTNKQTVFHSSSTHTQKETSQQMKKLPSNLPIEKEL